MASGLNDHVPRKPQFVAEREKLGLAGVLPEAEVTPVRLARDVEAMLAKPKPNIPPLDLDGATKTAEILERRIAL